jgi:hypothetical protein
MTDQSGEQDPAPAAGAQKSASSGFGLPDNFLSYSVISSVLLFGILLVKIYGVAHFNINIVATLASTSPASVALGTISIYSYFFLAMIGSASAWLAVASLAPDAKFKALRGTLVFVTVFLFLLTPWRYFLDAMILSLLLVGLQRFARWLWRKARPNDWPKFSVLRASMASLGVISALFILVTLDQPWAPAEIVTLSHKVVTNQTTPDGSMSQRPVAFVLAEDKGSLELLIDDDRTVIYVDPADVKSRQICNLNDNPSSSDPVFENLLGDNYGAHVLSCWRSTDQADEHAKMNAPLPIRLLEWCPRKPYPHPKGKEVPCW